MNTDTVSSTNKVLNDIDIRNKRLKLVEYVTMEAIQHQMESFRTLCKNREDDSRVDELLMDVCDQIVADLQDKLDDIKNADDITIEERYAEYLGEK